MTDLPQDSQPAPARKIIKAHDIRQAILKRFAAPEYAVMFEVGDATGARHSRFADAVIMSLWPSRSLELHGVEIKVNAADWRREARETIARIRDLDVRIYCLGLTKDGWPKHPLYLRADTPLIPYPGDADHG